VFDFIVLFYISLPILTLVDREIFSVCSVGHCDQNSGNLCIEGLIWLRIESSLGFGQGCKDLLLYKTVGE
jgi:hypothetical protein